MLDFCVQFFDGSLKGRSVWVRGRYREEAQARANELAAVTKATRFTVEAM